MAVEREGSPVRALEHVAPEAPRLALRQHVWADSVRPVRTQWSLATLSPALSSLLCHPSRTMETHVYDILS